MSYEEDYDSVAAAVEGQDKQLLSLLKEFNRADVGAAFRAMVRRWIEVFQERHVRCNKDDIDLWRGAIIACESMLQTLQEVNEAEEEIQEFDDTAMNFDVEGI